MVSLFIFLILVFILFELNFFSLKAEKEKFTTRSKYDNYFNGDIILKDNETPVNIGVGKEPNSEYLIDVNGKLTINGNLQIGTSVLNYDLAKKINKLPLYSRDKYCLYDSKGNKQCITEDQLGMITGHNKVMFKNRFGETLSNLNIRHHGPHNRSQSGRPDSGWDTFHEGIQYRDFNTKWGYDSINDLSKGYPLKATHDTLENSSVSTANSNNQFKLIPIEEIDVRISDDDADIKNILIYNSRSQRLLKAIGDSIALIYLNRKYVEETLGQFEESTTDSQKLLLKSSIESNTQFVENNTYLKLQKVKDQNKYYIRVYNSITNTWKYLESLNDNNHHNNGKPIANLLKDYPTVRCKFRIGSNTETPFSVDNPYQDVYFLSEDDRYLTLGTWNGYAYDLVNGPSVRFLKNMGGEVDSKFLMYIEPNISSIGDDEEDIFTPSREYKCV